nr:MAG TPA: hypothetical protein [Caudoviricetes sp.]
MDNPQPLYYLVKGSTTIRIGSDRIEVYPKEYSIFIENIVSSSWKREAYRIYIWTRLTTEFKTEGTNR